MSDLRRLGARAAPLVAALIAALMAAPGAGAADEPDRYKNCVLLVTVRPAAALVRPLAWGDAGGGVPARHCIALALQALGDYRAAARGFHRLAVELDHAPAEIGAKLYAQAGNAWLRANQPKTARVAFDQALKLTPEDPDLLIDRALAYADIKDYRAAIEDLDAAIRHAPERADVWVLRATAYRRLGEGDQAGADIAEALARDPANADGLVERGLLNLEAGEAAAARRDFAEVLVLAPDSPAAELARDYLDQLDKAEPP
ncbi:MAG: tetratricopeptide repeat protein [Alphaproteobacteria bacterium]|nr:tetratricopeptide repeat protein [Alphaproteobacteria bacterium]